MGQAILPADRLSRRSCRLKGGCGQDWPPHKNGQFISRQLLSASTKGLTGFQAHARAGTGKTFRTRVNAAPKTIRKTSDWTANLADKLLDK